MMAQSALLFARVATVAHARSLTAAGRLDGDYIQSGAGTLAVELGGTAAGQFDVLNVAGTTTLGGTLNIANINGFTPTVGDTFRVIESVGNPGTFQNLTGTIAGLLQQADGTGLRLVAALQQTFIWDNSAGTGDWFNPLNWDLDSGVPGPVDTAILNIGSTINLSSAVNVANFQQTTGTLTGIATLTISTSLTWTGGTMSGAGATNADRASGRDRSLSFT